ncbi:MAG: methyltransferase domain-containing protein [Anaerolineales bacterium]|jgi:SAM-dependent methyltransferase|nr:methyltransferase domain-containing protein [Anaerolineales bacterium]
MKILQMTRSYLRKLRSYYFPDRTAGIFNEVDFWREWLATHALGNEEEFRFRLDPDARVQPYYADLIDRIDKNQVEILDVGAGPLTTIGKIHPNKKLHITAVDPLADAYQLLLNEAGFHPPIITISCSGENLSTFFSNRSFDLVISENALDHTEDPVKIIREMISVCNSGGIIALVHRVKEGNNQSYRGLHTWNFYLRNGDLIVSGKRYKCNITKLFPEMRFRSLEAGGFIYSDGLKP